MVELIRIKEIEMACSSCGKARAAATSLRNRNAGTTSTGIKTVDSQSIKPGSPTTVVTSSPNRTASTRTKV